MSSILLTSTGLSVEHIKTHFIKIVKDPAASSVSIICNACKDGKDNKYARLAQEQFLDLGFQHVNLFNVLTDNLVEIFNSQILYICGGNTFKLMSELYQSQSIPLIYEFALKKDNIILGVSAGSIVLGESLDTTFDENDVGLKNHEGLKLVPFSVIVHFDNTRVSKYQQLSQTKKVKTLTNSQAIFIDSSGEHFIDN
jgi:dipeptidase E